MKQNHKLIFLWIVLVAFLILPHLLRIKSGNYTIMGDLSYQDLYFAKNIQQKGFFLYDEIQQTSYFPHPFHILLSLFNLEIGARLLPFLLGMLTGVLFFFLMKEHNEQQASLLISFIFFISPAFIYTFVTSTKESLGLFILIATLYLARFPNPYFYFSFLLGLLLPFVSLIAAIASIPFLFFFKKTAKESNLIYFIIAASILVYLFIPQQPFYLPDYDIFNLFLSDFAGTIGFALFGFVLAVIGFFSLPSKRNIAISAACLLIIFLLGVFVSHEFNIYMNILVAFFAGYGFNYLLEREWRLSFVRDISIFLLICGLLFSAFSFSNRISSSLPNEAVRESMLKINEKSLQTEVVFSHSSRALWINYFAERRAYPSFFSVEGNTTAEIVKSRNLELTKSLLEKENIYFIWLDNEVKENYWERNDEGLLFLLRNHETFKNIYTENNIKIVRVSYDGSKTN